MVVTTQAAGGVGVLGHTTASDKISQYDVIDAPHDENVNQVQNTSSDDGEYEHPVYNHTPNSDTDMGNESELHHDAATRDGLDNLIAEKRQVEVLFWTALGKDFETSPNPFVVPTNLSRYGLSEVINHLLGRTRDESQPFEFLIDGELLRVTLDRYLRRKGLSSEVSLSVEYTLARPCPKTEIVDKQPDWISKVHWLHAEGDALHVQLASTINIDRISKIDSIGCTAGADGICRIYGATDDSSGKNGSTPRGTHLYAMPLSTVPLSAAKVVNPQGKATAEHFEVVSCSKSGEIKFCKFSPAAMSHTEISRGISHTDSAECIAISQDAAIVATAGSDGRILLWDNQNILDSLASTAASVDTQVQSRKAKRKRPPAPPVQCPASAIGAASDEMIKDLQFVGDSNRYLLSASLDKTVRCWDTVSLSPVAVFPVARAALSVDVHPASHSICCTAHEEGHVRIWDIRSGNSLDAPTSAIPPVMSSGTSWSLRKSYNVHSRMVNEARWSITDTNVLASCGSDGRLNIVDIRLSKIPIQSISLKEESLNATSAESTTTKADATKTNDNSNWKLPVKITGLCWAGPNLIASGGSDGILRLHKL